MTSFPEETERFKEYVASQNLRWTAQRQALLVSFLSHSGHLSAENLHLGTDAGRKTGFATVYRTLKHLVACGLAREVDLGDGRLYFEKTSSDGHHDHLMCVGCGEVIEFLDAKIENLQEKVVRQYGYQITHHRLMLYGLCPKCQKMKGKKLTPKHLKTVPKMSVKGYGHGRA